MKLTMISRDDLVYLAASVDCDGCIGAYAKRSEQYQIAVVVTNTNPVLPLWLESVFGGSIANGRKRERRKPSYDWWITGDAAVRLLDLVTPFLKLKAEQAKIVTAMRTLQVRLGHEKSAPVLRVLKFKLSDLNRRGEVA